MKALVFCDIDGCLSVGKNSPFDLPRLAEIRNNATQLAELGVGFTLCTGRPQPYAEAMAQILSIDLPLVCEGGALVYEPATDAYRPVADADSLRGIADLQLAIQSADLISEDLYFEVGNAYSMCLTGPSLSERGHAVIRAQMDSLMSQFADYPVSWSHSTTSIDITPLGVDKGSGVRVICADYGVALANTAGIGDSNGDVGTFNVAARGYCPSNASDELKSLASYISNQSFVAGTLDILQEMQNNPIFFK